jgi:hypothetical protein
VGKSLRRIQADSGKTAPPSLIQADQRRENPETTSRLIKRFPGRAVRSRGGLALFDRDMNDILLDKSFLSGCLVTRQKVSTKIRTLEMNGLFYPAFYSYLK